MTQGNNPKNKNSKQGSGQQPSTNRSTGQQPKASGGARSTGEQKRSVPATDRPFTAKSRVRSGAARTLSNDSDNDRRSSAGGGSRAAERKQEREQERQRRRLTVGAISIAVVVVLAIVTFFLVNTPADAPIPDTAVARYEGLQQTTTQDGYPQLGNPNAPVRVGLYSSFDCPHCREFHEGYQAALVERVRTNNMSLIFYPLYGTGGITNGEGAARASMCATDQGKFWQMQDALFHWQGLYVNQAFTNNRIQTGANALGVDVRNGCISSSDTNLVLTNARNAASTLQNFSGTPTITINGVVPTGDDQVAITDRDALIVAIDAELARVAGNNAPEATDEPALEATTEATSEAAAVEVTPEVTPEEQPEPTPEVTEAS